MQQRIPLMADLKESPSIGFDSEARRPPCRSAPGNGLYANLREKARGIRAARRESRRRQRWPIDPHADPWSIPLKEINVANPELFKHNLFEPYFARLRAEAPVHYCKASQYGPYWSITRYRDILEVEKAHQVFSSSYELGGVLISGSSQSVSETPMFIQMDPPKHDIQRKAVAPRFTQSSLQALEGLIRSRAGRILDGLPRGEAFDWVSQVSVELTGRMLASLFGLPQRERRRLVRWSNIFSNADNPEQVASSGDYYEALAECGDYFQEVWADRAGRPPAGDLISMLAHGPSTRNMSPKELLGNVVLLLVGGNDTTRNSISGGVLALHEHPSEQEKLRGNPGLVASMVPEIIRWQTPLTHMRRTALRDQLFQGQSIRAGDAVVLWYISGNRDSSAIERADQFIIDRPRPRQHLSFGFGIHRCLGNRLAELQLRVLWEEIMRRRLGIEVVGPPERVNSVMFRAINRLPVRLV